MQQRHILLVIVSLITACVTAQQLDPATHTVTVPSVMEVTALWYKDRGTVVHLEVNLQSKRDDVITIPRSDLECVRGSTKVPAVPNVDIWTSWNSDKRMDAIRDVFELFPEASKKLQLICKFAGPEEGDLKLNIKNIYE